MKYGAHENSCNGPGDCSCGQDYREFADRAVDREIAQAYKELAKLTKAAKRLENK